MLSCRLSGNARISFVRRPECRNGVTDHFMKGTPAANKRSLNVGTPAKEPGETSYYAVPSRGSISGGATVNVANPEQKSMDGPEDPK